MKTIVAVSIIAPLALTGCVGVTTEGERRARQDVEAVRYVFRPLDERPDLPQLTADSTLDDFLRFAMLNQPQVAAAYYDWTAAVERVTVERSLPDPKLTFEAFIADTVMSLMPGLMVDFPGPGKLGARANVATAESRAKYFQFESAVLQAAFALKKSVAELYFADEKVRVSQQSLALLDDLETLARSQNEVGKATLQDVLRVQGEQERLRTEIAGLADSRRSRVAQFKAALGLTSGQPTPPEPKTFAPAPPDFSDEQLWATALARNPRLKAMEADVRRAEAALEVARKERVPDFSVGSEVDLKAAPAIWNPQFSVTLPIWRDKLAAQIAAAQAGKSAAEARLTAEEISLAVEFAEKSFMLRETGRNLDLLQNQLLPRTRQSLEFARSGYRSGQVDFVAVIDAERSLLDLERAIVEARAQRELALAELSVLLVAVPPPGAPVLDNVEGDFSINNTNTFK